MRRILYAFSAVAVIALLFSGARKIFAQGAQPRSMVTRAVDETERIALRGNVHPLANAQSDQGAVASTMQVNHMLLVLKRSPEQEAALENLIAQQADKTSPNITAIPAYAAITSRICESQRRKVDCQS